MPRLILYPGLPNERIVELTKASMTIGRATENDVFILDRSLSRKHARLDVVDGGVSLSDLNSTNGVEVNGAKVQSVKLALGDAIRIGDIPILFVEDPRIVKEYVPEATRLTIEEILAEKTDDIDISALPEMVREATQRARDKLRILLKVSEILSSPEGIDTLLQRIVDLLFQIMAVDRASILLLDEASGELEPKTVKTSESFESVLATRASTSEFRIPRVNPFAVTAGFPPPADREEEPPAPPPPAGDRGLYSRHIVNYVLDKGVGVLISDAHLDTRFGAVQSILEQSIQSSMCAPLRAKDRTVGVLYVDNVSVRDGFKDEDLEFLSAFANQAAVAIENARLYQKIEDEAVLRNNFLRFFPPATIKRIQAQKNVFLGAIETEVTALFCDISNFTAITSRMNPKEVVDMLNEYFPVMADVVFRHEGTLEKYIGDALLAVWGAPFQHEDDVGRAVRAAIEMQRETQKLNDRWAGKRRLEVHIGLNSGKVAAGNIGSERYIQYATIGDTTNMTSRICNIARPGEILVSHSVKARLPQMPCPITELPPTLVKGRDEPLMLFRLDWA